MKIIISEQQYRRLFLKENELPDVDYVQFIIDGIIESLRDKCVTFLHDYYNSDDTEEFDYDSIELCRVLDSLDEIKVHEIGESSYSYSVEVDLIYNEIFPRTIGYGQDHILSELEHILSKKLNKQTFIYHQGNND
jgi:hypothetical protein